MTRVTVVTSATSSEGIAHDVNLASRHIALGAVDRSSGYDQWFKVEETPRVDSDSEQPDLVRSYITFGMQYAREPHPTFPAAHPNGYFVIEAPTAVACRELAVLLFQRHWAFDYGEAEFDPSFHPLGELGRISTRSFFHAG